MNTHHPLRRFSFRSIATRLRAPVVERSDTTAGCHTTRSRLLCAGNNRSVERKYVLFEPLRTLPPTPPRPWGQARTFRPRPQTKARLRCALAALLSLSLAAPAWAIKPATWAHTTEADFAPGHNQDTVVTNLGDVKLARRTQALADLPQDAGIVYDLQPSPDGSVYLAVGPECSLLRHRNGQIEKLLDLPDEQAFALGLAPDGRLLVALSSASCRIAALNADNTLETLVQLPGIRYIWDMIVDDSGLLLATGTDGKLLHVDLWGNAAANGPQTLELLDAAQNNLLCLGRDSLGRIYVGSDTDGLVYRVTLKPDASTEAFVLYDAPEPEIGALLVRPDGTVFAGTADANQARPGRLEEAAASEAGRPQAPTTIEIEPAPPPEEPGDLPQVPPPPEPMRQPSGGPPSQGPVSLSPTPQAGEPIAPETAGPSHTATTANSAHPSTTPAKTPPSTAAGPETVEASDTQADLLRELIRQRLEQALSTSAGEFRSDRPQVNGEVPPARIIKRKTQTTSEQAPSAREGNAIYRIGPDGFVTEVFRESVMILDLMEDPSDSDKLLVATGNEGELFLVDPAAEETSILVDLEPQQIPRMTRDAAGQVLLGTANPPSLLRLETGFAPQGTYTSTVLDANQVSLWGKMHLTGITPPGTTIAVQTRAGNVQDPDQAAWSAWSAPVVLEHSPATLALTPRLVPIVSPPARFLQYRLTLVGDARTTSVVDRVQIAYVVPNLKPQVTSIRASYSPDGEPSSEAPNNGAYPQPPTRPNLQIDWEADDPNGDQLLFTLEYQPEGSGKWLPLARDLQETSFQWDTRHVPDGRYTLRVIAADSPDNTPDMASKSIRLSDPVLVDNTPPALRLLSQRVDADTASITGIVTDALSPITAIHYSVDSDELWQPVAADDLIYDSPRETFTVTIPNLSPGQHAVTIRVTDSRGNALYQAVFIEVGEK